MSKSTLKLLNCNQAARMLSISMATLRNWVKTGEIQPTENGTADGDQYSLADIIALQARLRTSTGRLRSRRNKSAIAGHAIPWEYIRYEPYREVVAAVSKFAGPNPQRRTVGLILCELALALNDSKGSQKAASTKRLSYTERLLDSESISLIEQRSLQIPGSDPLNEPERQLLRSIASVQLAYVPGEDLLGLVYLGLKPRNQRKQQGAYYTPSDIVAQMVQTVATVLPDRVPCKVLDPCCGSGNFLINLELPQTLLLHGTDTDPVACTLAELNVMLLLQSQQQQETDIRCQSALTDDRKDYDLIISNPPWGSVGTSGKEAFALFLENGLQRLRQGGGLCFLLPEAFLNVERYATLRQHLCTTSQLVSLFALGRRFSQVFAQSVIVTVVKKTPDLHKTVLLTHGEERHGTAQKRFLNNPSQIFNILTRDQDQRLLDALSHHPQVFRLQEQADFAMGIVTGNNRGHVSKEQGDGAEQIIIGAEVFRYNMYPTPHYIRYTPENFQQTAPIHYYRRKEKLIYRFINTNLVVAYDDQQRLVLNSANLIIPQVAGYEILYLLAVLNSRPAQFFFTYTFHSIKVLRRHMEAIPMAPCPPDRQQVIVQLVRQLLRTTTPSARRQLFEAIDHIIIGLYELDRRELQYLTARVGNANVLYPK